MTLITNLSLVFHKTGYRPGKNRFYKHAPLIAWFYQIFGPYSYFCEEIATPGKLIALITNPMLDFTKNRFITEKPVWQNRILLRRSYFCDENTTPGKTNGADHEYGVRFYQKPDYNRKTGLAKPDFA